MPCVWPLNPQLLQATKPLWGGYVTKMARKHFVTEIFPCLGKISVTKCFRAILVTYPPQSGFVACSNCGLSGQTQGIRPRLPATVQNQCEFQRLGYPNDLRCHAELDAPAQAAHQSG